MIGFTLSAAQESEVAFETGVSADGTLAAQSFFTWDRDTPATYGSTDYEAKYGARETGAGADISYSFAAASNWTPTEENAFRASMALWSEVANVHFTELSSGGNFTITRGSDGAAEAGTTSLHPGAVGGTQLGGPVSASLSIDTSVPGFGPLGDAFNGYGGYPWTTVEHELGHILGLGHTGDYDEGVTTQTNAYGPYDSRAYSIMSYIDPPSTPFGWTITSVSGAREEGSPVTPQDLDIVAVERLYGLPTSTPLAGGQIFGFHSNIVGVTEPFFDFSNNTQPIVTLWDEGTGNTLDLSGFAQSSAVDLHAGAFSSAGGLTYNIAIAYGTQIDAAIGGANADLLIANDDGDTLTGGGGGDTLYGGAGHDLQFGNAGNDVIMGGAGASTLFGGQGDDQLIGAGYLSGDAGNDFIEGTGTADTLLGGDGDDRIAVGDHGLAFGNMGSDTIYANNVSATIFGGQGDDYVTVSGSPGGFVFGNIGNDHLTGSGFESMWGGQGDDVLYALNGPGEYLSGDIGNDTIMGAGGNDTLVGGPGADVLEGSVPYDPNASASLVPPAPPSDHNVYLYRSLSDSTPDAPDQIIGFNTSRDTVDITALEAGQAAAGHAAFHWAAALDGGAGEAALVYDAGSNTTTLLLDADGDRVADAAVVFSGQVVQGGWLIF